MLTFIKFGGSVITDKTIEEVAELAVIMQLATEVRAALDRARSDATPYKLIIGHGSGSFGHTYAKRYGVHLGIPPGRNWEGFALTSAAALRLNRIVVDELLAADVPALSLQPSASLRSERGELVEWNTATLALALERDLVPVIHGDVGFDTAQGSAIISTEQLLVHLAGDPQLRPSRVILVGEAGVYTADPRANPDAQRIPRIDASNIDTVLRGTGESHGVDVTGGLRAKVELMWRLVQTTPGLSVQLISPTPGHLKRALLGNAESIGTVIQM
jgi:isopentenyl phosphate kinase